MRGPHYPYDRIWDDNRFPVIAPVPEPETYGLMGVGLIVITVALRKLRTKNRSALTKSITHE